jgi:hypothetical protein
MSRNEKATRQGGPLVTFPQTPNDLSVAGDRHLTACFQREAESDERYKELDDPNVQQHLLNRITLMDRQTETWMSQERTLEEMETLPSPSGGRPSEKGISKPTANKYDAKLEAAGLLSWRWSQGKIVGSLRTAPIKVWRLADSIRVKAWARFKAWRETMLRMLNRLLRKLSERTFYTDKARAKSPSLRGDSSVLVSSRQSRQQLERWHGAALPVVAIERIYGQEKAVEYAAYLAARGGNAVEQDGKHESTSEDGTEGSQDASDARDRAGSSRGAGSATGRCHGGSPQGARAGGREVFRRACRRLAALALRTLYVRSAKSGAGVYPGQSSCRASCAACVHRL